MFDVVISGAGPAGAFAALLLARRGARVRLLERARFPRDKLCGDTLNPGALRTLARHLDLAPLAARALPLEGMRVTGPGGVEVRGRYGRGIAGLAIVRRDFDAWLLEHALAAGAAFDEGVTVTRPAMVGSGDVIDGVHFRATTGTPDVVHARMVIGADGRKSPLAAQVQVARQPARPRRWAVGRYFAGVDALEPLGEMHVRRGRYIGVAPLPHGVANVCLVEPIAHGGAWRDPAARLDAALAAEPLPAPRFARATPVSAPQVLGPMAVDVSRPGAPGLLLAGDAAGFIDPITGDGLRYALAGAELVADVVGDVLAGAITPHAALDRLAARRHAAFARKWRFNRALRHLVSWPAAIGGAGLLAAVSARPFETLIRYAGDCDVM